MRAYFIVDNEVTDPAGFEEYRKQVPATLQKYGGKILVRGGQVQTLEGDWKPKRIVVTEFPSLEQARRWYDSEEYRPLKALRLRAEPRHSMRRSARSNSDCGIVRPSALAVFTLISRSNFAGCSTGSSAGLAPLRILST